MTDWTCTHCGTHNDDPIDAIFRQMNNNGLAGLRLYQEKEYMDRLSKMIKERNEYYSRGEKYPEHCTRCTEQRI